MKNDRRSLYECPNDPEHVVEASPCARVICTKCHVVMREVKKGVINK